MVVNTVTAGSSAPDERLPMYMRIQDHFLDQIRSGALGVGDQLPIETEIAKFFGTSRATVQTAMARLVHEGWITKQAGRGTFVSGSVRSAMIDLDEVRSFEEEAAHHGHKVTYRLIKAGRIGAPVEVAERLSIEPDAVIFHFERLRLLDGENIGMERRYFTPDTPLDFPFDALESLATHVLVETYFGKEIGRMDVTIRAVAADADIAGKMELDAGAPLLLRRHTMYSTSDDIILFGEAYYCEPFAFRYSARTAARQKT